MYTSRIRRARKGFGGWYDRFIHHSQHPFAVPVATFLVLGLIVAVVLFNGGAENLRSSNSHIVILSYDKQQRVVPTLATTVGDMVKRISLVISEGDVIEPALDTPILEDNFRVNVYRARPVTIIDNDKKTLVNNAASTPRSVATQAGLTVLPEDEISFVPVENILADGIAQKLVIERSQPLLLNVYGTLSPIRSRSKTVGDVLAEKNVQVAKDDTVVPAVDTKITPNIQVFVTRVGTQIATEESAIPADVEVIDDPSLSFGTTVVRQAGSPGKKLTTYKIDLQNGVEAGRTKLQEVIVTAPIKQVEAHGKAVAIPIDKEGLMAQIGIVASDYPYVNYIISRESGWCHTKWQGQVGSCPAGFAHLYAGDETNPSLGFGLCQSTPAIKMASAGADWQTNPITQLRWCAGYAQGRYGSWAAAYNHWVNYHNW